MISNIRKLGIGLLAALGLRLISFATVLTDIDLISSSAGQPLILLPSSGSVNIGDIPYPNKSGGTAALAVRGIPGNKDVFQLFSSTSGYMFPFIRVQDNNGTVFITSNMNIMGNYSGFVLPDGSIRPASIPYTGWVKSMASIQSDLGNNPDTPALIVQSGGPLAEMIRGYSNDSFKNFSLWDSGLITTQAGVQGGVNGLTLFGGDGGARNITLIPGGTGSVVMDFTGGSAVSGLTIKNKAANHTSFALRASDVAGVDFSIQLWSDQGALSYALISGGVGPAVRIYHASSDVEILQNLYADKKVVAGGSISPSGSTATWTAGPGDPEGVVVANPGSLYSRTAVGEFPHLYVKETGTWNTGWVAK